ncbi:hypothetical protein [Jannaschia helgolandensis]|uniref:hypothetical protein n=1 Tax=Jannaschia helgolandensis TaxID=188906 RepID=UPI0030D71316
MLAGLQVNPVQATQDVWPALFDVAADDVLNLRNGLSLDAIFGEQVLSGCCTLAP